MDITVLHTSWQSIVFQPKQHHEDQWVWTGHSSGHFSIRSTWDLLRDKRPLNNIHLLLWFKGHIPRQSFILWLAGLGRLRTMDRLYSAGIIRNASYVELTQRHMPTFSLNAQLLKLSGKLLMPELIFIGHVALGRIYYNGVQYNTAARMIYSTL